MDLLALADFTLVAKHGGFGKASRAAGRPKATLSRRVTELEEALSLRLFERGGRTIKLTEEGRALFERTYALLSELDDTAAVIALGGGTPRGRLRISAPLLFSQIAMGRIAAEFALRYPEVQLEVTTDDREVDMIEEGYDLVIRVNPKTNEGLVGRAFLRDRLVVAASPRLVRPNDGETVRAVMRGAGGGNGWTVIKDGGRSHIAFEPILRLSSPIMVRDAVRAGVGAAALPYSLISQDIAAGNLTHWGDVDLPPTALWTLYPTRRLLSARVSAFLDHLRQTFPQGTSEELAAFMTA
ncbi:LysR substrate-binding domain-containing protein [Methylobacterium sp. E-005]|uniref:LysR family transcriptional regulator n=1 Tax=Methylobacterium sp. E-005 TaxID=2836549 RepID=UPI001FB9D999|nr:LysR family transcriptional regulator [Methylobacterium sp. E-005]MCJ2085347.1 LysR substrate-binding domain-containing protein [Methylobacterium sp. E-005]